MGRTMKSAVSCCVMVFLLSLGEKTKRYLKLIVQWRRSGRGICLGGSGVETLIDNLKSFMAHYSSDNLKTAVGGIDRGDEENNK